MTETPQVLLAHHLKTLKLPTFLREYDKVARQCAAEGVDYPRYLLRLAELELIDRERRMVERRIKAAKFPTVKSLDSFDFAPPTTNSAIVFASSRLVGSSQHHIEDKPFHLDHFSAPPSARIRSSLHHQKGIRAFDPGCERKGLRKEVIACSVTCRCAPPV